MIPSGKQSVDMDTAAQRDELLPARVAMTVIRAIQLLLALILIGWNIYGLAGHNLQDSVYMGPAIGLPVVSAYHFVSCLILSQCRFL